MSLAWPNEQELHGLWIIYQTHALHVPPTRFPALKRSEIISREFFQIRLNSKLSTRNREEEHQAKKKPFFCSVIISNGSEVKDQLERDIFATC